MVTGRAWAVFICDDYTFNLLLVSSQRKSGKGRSYFNKLKNSFRLLSDKNIPLYSSVVVQLLVSLTPRAETQR